MKNTKKLFVSFVGAFLFSMIFVAQASAQCTFTTVGSTMYLDADCDTTTAVVIPDGNTLDLNGNTITAVEVTPGAFVGAVVRAGGAVAYVRDGIITASNLANACKAGSARLSGILFDGASGTIDNVNVTNINKGPSGCQEGNAIWIQNPPFDNTPGPRTVVTIKNVTVTDYQKTGIVMNGHVDVTVTNSTVGTSATQAYLAANAVQVGFGGLARIERNKIGMNSWHTATATATGALLYSAAPGTVFSQNNMMEGNADTGIYIFSDGVIVENNKVFESGPDGSYDYGIGNWGTNNVVYNNKVRGFDVPYDGTEGQRNVTIPSPQDD